MTTRRKRGPDNLRGLSLSSFSLTTTTARDGQRTWTNQDLDPSGTTSTITWSPLVLSRESGNEVPPYIYIYININTNINVYIYIYIPTLRDYIGPSFPHSLPASGSREQADPQEHGLRE